MTTTVLDQSKSNYSTETLIRYAFHHEVQNRLKIDPNAEQDPKLLAVIEYMEKRIGEISKKFQ